MYKIEAYHTADDMDTRPADRAYALGAYCRSEWATREEAEEIADELREGVGTVVDADVVYQVEETD